MSESKRDDETLVWRHLAGEGTDAERAELARRLAADPLLAGRLEAAHRAWNGLELPPPGPVPPGFAARVAARVAERDRFATGSRPQVRTPGRLAAAAALLIGAALGSLLALRIGAVEEEEIADTSIAARYLAAADVTAVAVDAGADTLELDDEGARP